MAKRYRYAFAKKREAQQGKLCSSAGGCFTGFICDCSFAGIFFAGTIRIYCRRDQSLRNASVCIWICDGTEKLFRNENRTHKAGMIGSIANGIIMIGWLGIFLMGISG